MTVKKINIRPGALGVLRCENDYADSSELELRYRNLIVIIGKNRVEYSRSIPLVSVSLPVFYRFKFKKIMITAV